MKARILLVEDNPVTRRIVSATLVDAGYGVLIAGTGEQAISVLARGPIDLVLLDLVLPDASWTDLMPKLHANAATDPAPVIALSEEREELPLLAAGFADMLVKPIDPMQLLSALRVHLGRPMHDPPGEGKRLLLVDQSPRVLRRQARCFEQLGFEVLAVESGPQALARLAESQPSVVVSELLLQGMDGFELCLNIHALPGYAGLPIVLVSAQPLGALERELAVRMGASASVSRAADLNVLVDAVLNALSPRSSRSRPPNVLITQEHRRHAIATLDQRAQLREDLARRDGTLRAVRSIHERLSELCGRPRDEVLFGALASLLDAVGFSLGIAYLRNTEGSLEVGAQIGFSRERAPELAAFFGHLPLLLGVTEMAEPRGACASQALGSIQQVLSLAQVGAMVIVPLRSEGRWLGALVLASPICRLAPDWLLLCEIVSGPISSALALAETTTQLVETEQRFHGIADSTAEGIAVSDADGQIGYANAALLRILDLPARAVVGRPVSEILPFMADGAANGSGTVARTDGGSIPVEVTARGVEDVQGSPCRVFVVRDLSEALRLSEVAWLVSHDSLTGLYSRRRFEEELKHRVSESRRYKAQCAVLLLDLDHFKIINDTYGHPAGDAVLTAVAETLRKTTRESDIPARLGGDEFVVLLPQANLEQARACAAKVFERVAELRPTYQGWSMPVAVSIGIAVYPDHGETPEALVASADEALYRAKRGGRSRICVQSSRGSFVSGTESGSIRLDAKGGASDSCSAPAQEGVAEG